MRCKLIKIKGTWRQVADSANTTIHREAGTKEPSSQWKRRMLIAEHSPIRQITVKAKWYDLKYWVSVHLVRHKIGIEHWVRTQRTDRTGVNRDNLPQGNLVEHEIEANAQAIINISRKRLCSQASPETREAWQAFLDSFKDKEPELYSVCVKECVYRGFCPEYNSCNYHKTKAFQEELARYRANINP
jgi:hypothetical protein